MQNEKTEPAPEPVPQTIDKAEKQAVDANDNAKNEIDKLNKKGEEKEEK